MKHITIIVKERTGVLKEIAEILGGSGINIEDINAIVIGDKGAITIGVDEGYYQKAVKLLTDLGHKPLSNNSIIIRLEDKPGKLAEIADVLASNNISIINISLIDKDKGMSFLILSTTDNDMAKKLLANYIYS